MSYIDGFVVAVPQANKDVYRSHSRRAWELFRRHGALAHWECWEDDVPEGKVTSFPMAVQRQPGEAVVFSWIEWPDRATRDRGYQAMQADPEMADMAEMPFDGKRMIYGGFVPLMVERA
jgi:uncharacterized protein YbaA (DUF1428 family)